MIKSEISQEKLFKLINARYSCREHKTNDLEDEFVLLIKPFNNRSCLFVIEKLHNVDNIRLLCIIRPSATFKKILKELPENERYAIMEQFDKLCNRQLRTKFMFSENHETIQHMRDFSTQNLSIQSLIDSIFLNIVVAKEVIKFLNIIDGNTD